MKYRGREQPPAVSERLTHTLRRIGATAVVGCLPLLLGCDSVAGQHGLPVGQYPTVVAVGDSYAAGLGATGDGNACRRSNNGYPGIVAEKLQALHFFNIACEGWGPADVLHGKDGTPSQIEQLPANANLVLISVGGNATNLRDFGKACLSQEGCGPGSPALTDAMRIYLSAEYRQQVKEVCEQVLEKAPGALALLEGYSKPVEPHPLLAWVGISPFGEANDKGAAAIIDAMNAVAQQVVAQINSPRLFYGTPAAHIDVLSTKLGSGQVDFHLDKDPNSTTTGHPNDRGYKVMAGAVLSQVGIISREIQLKSDKVARS